jgi:hypothetical protein
VVSLPFREKTAKWLNQNMDEVDPGDVAQKLAKGRVRVASRLSQDVAEALVARLGPRECKARIVRGEPDKLGLKGFMKGGLPFAGLGLGVIATVAWNPIGLVIGGGLGIVLGLVNASKRIPSVGVLPFAPMLDEESIQAAKRYVAIRKSLDAPSYALLEGVVKTGFDVVAWITDPDDVVALSSGGLHGPLGDKVIKVIQSAVGVGMTAVQAGRNAFSAEEKESLERLKGLIDRVWSRFQGTEVTSDALHDIERVVDEEVESMELVADEFFVS